MYFHFANIIFCFSSTCGCVLCWDTWFYCHCGWITTTWSWTWIYRDAAPPTWLIWMVIIILSLSIIDLLVIDSVGLRTSKRATGSYVTDTTTTSSPGHPFTTPDITQFHAWTVFKPSESKSLFFVFFSYQIRRKIKSCVAQIFKVKLIQELRQ